jgi:peptide/nickel transport system substrate-binding protein
MTTAPHRGARLFAAPLLALSLLLPAAAPAAAADPVVLRVGTTQDLDATNPYQTALVVGYEAFQLSYNLLTDFGPNLEPAPGFADSWTRDADGVTFHIREGMKWSDGTPATSADACYSWQLGLDAINDPDLGYLGLGYLDPSLTDAGVTKVECPDDQTMKVYTEDTSDRVFQSYMPIIPKHIWGQYDYKTIVDQKFDAPLVGTGPYTLAEWKTGEYLRFVRNPNYWGTQAYPDEVVIQVFGGTDTMVQALKAGEIDYARGVNADQLNQLKTEADVQTVAGTANGWTQLAFNSYGTGTTEPKTIKGGGPSTQALLDPAFRDALGYAVNRQLLVDRVLGGYGEVGSTIVPPALTKWHVDPANPRTFDIELAKQKLDAAGYKLDDSGRRLDKEGKQITLRLYMPDSDENYPKAAQFIQDWYGQLGIKVVTQVFDSATLVDLELPPQAGGDANKADYDISLWGWSGNPDPNALLQIFKCDAIGTSSDSQWCDPEFDKMYDEQLAAKTPEERLKILTDMQNLVYDQAVYDILYYDANLDAYRTDRFAGWQNQPENGNPMFTYSTIGYTKLTDAAAAVPSATPEAPAASSGATAAPAATEAPAAGGIEDTGSTDNTTLILVVVAIAVVVVIGVLIVVRRRSAAPTADDE